MLGGAPTMTFATLLTVALLTTATPDDAVSSSQEAPPPGSVRDDHGRLVRVSFDLNRRIYFGAGWAPLWLARAPDLQSRYRAEFGIDLEFPDDAEDTLYRLHLFKGEFVGGSDLSSHWSALTFDWSHSGSLAQVTTFFGKASRTDVHLDLGWYLEAGRYDTLRRAGVVQTDVILATGQPTFDLWHSRDLVSFVRLRAGPGAGWDTLRNYLYLLGEAALEADVTLDPNGFHHLRLLALGDKAFFVPALPGRPASPDRLRARAEYEVIFVAIDDQPLSLVLDGNGGWRNDLVGLPPTWEWSAGVTLRFNLWAPARRATTAL